MHIADHSVAYAHTKRVEKGQSPKIAQFAQGSTIFHMLQHGRSMMEYESMRALYGFLKMPHLSKNHWSNNLGCIMVEFLHIVLMRRAKNMLGVAKYAAITYDEATTVDN